MRTTTPTWCEPAFLFPFRFPMFSIAVLPAGRPGWEADSTRREETKASGKADVDFRPPPQGLELEADYPCDYTCHSCIREEVEEEGWDKDDVDDEVDRRHIDQFEEIEDWFKDGEAPIAS